MNSGLLGTRVLGALLVFLLVAGGTPSPVTASSLALPPGGGEPVTTAAVPSPGSQGSVDEPASPEPESSADPAPLELPEPDESAPPRVSSEPSSPPAPDPMPSDPSAAPAGSGPGATSDDPDESGSAAEDGYRTAALARISGSGQIGTAIAASRASRDPGVDVVYLGNVYSAAGSISAAAAAAERGGSLLWTKPTALDPRVLTEITRLRPTEVVLLGRSLGPQTEVARALSSAGVAVRHHAQSDRFAVSRAIVRESYERAAEVVVVSGRHLPESIAASAAAARDGLPVLAIDSSRTTLDDATVTALRALGTTKVHLMGRHVAVPYRFVQAFRELGFTVERSTAVDPEIASARIARSSFPSATGVMLASEAGLAGGLSSVSYADVHGSPIYLSRAGCVDPAVKADIEDRLGSPPVTLLGSANHLGAELLSVPSCFDVEADERWLEEKITTQLAGLPGRYTITVNELGGMRRTVAIGGSTAREPASVIKLFAAYVILARVDSGQVSLSTPTRSGISIGGCLRVMIHISDNLCHADLLAVLGNDAINRQLHAAGFTRTYYVGYDGNGVYQPAKRTTTDDVVRLLERLHTGALLSPSSSALLTKLMAEQLWRSKIPSGIEPGVSFGNKTGQLWVTGGLVEADAGIVHGPSGSYAISVFGSDNSTNWAVAQLSKTVFEHFAGRAIIPARWGSTNLVTPKSTTMFDKPGGVAIGTIPAGSRLKADSSNRMLYRVNYAGSWVWVHHSAVETLY